MMLYRVERTLSHSATENQWSARWFDNLADARVAFREAPGSAYLDRVYLDTNRQGLAALLNLGDANRHNLPTEGIDRKVGSLVGVLG